MDHPDIAKIFDAWTTEAGHPFFVMGILKDNSNSWYVKQLAQPTVIEAVRFGADATVK